MSFTSRLRADDIHRIDTSDMAGHIASMGAHLREAVQTCASLSVPIASSQCTGIIVLGMGGSAIGGDLVKAYLPSLAVPLVVNRSYTLPAWANEHTLIIASSYSGNTEETLSAFEQAVQKKLPILCITTGGTLGARAKELGLPVVVPKSGMQPRAALACGFVPILSAIETMGFIPSESQSIEGAAAMLDSLAERYGTNHLDEHNRAFQLAGEIAHRIPVFYTSVTEEAIAFRWRAQIQENGKHIAFCHTLPEMNHNEIEGWAHPIDLVQHFAIVLLRMKEEHPRIAKRFEALNEVLSSKQVDLFEFTAEGLTRMEQLFSLIALADWTSYYIALFAGIDPTSIDAIQDFKKKLG